MREIESIVDERLILDLYLIDLIRLVKYRFIKRYITSPCHLALAWNPDKVDIGNIMRNQKSNMCSR